MTLKQFLIKKYPPSRYVDCPIPTKFWKVMEEYADKFAASELEAKDKRIKELEAELHRMNNPPNNIDY